MTMRVNEIELWDAYSLREGVVSRHPGAPPSLLYHVARTEEAIAQATRPVRGIVEETMHPWHVQRRVWHRDMLGHLMRLGAVRFEGWTCPLEDGVTYVNMMGDRRIIGGRTKQNADWVHSLNGDWFERERGYFIDTSRDANAAGSPGNWRNIVLRADEIGDEP